MHEWELVLLFISLAKIYMKNRAMTLQSPPTSRCQKKSKKKVDILADSYYY